MQRHPACALVFSRSRVIDERGRDLRCNDARLEPGVQEGGDFIRHVLRLGNVVTSSGAVGAAKRVRSRRVRSTTTASSSATTS